MLPRLGAAWRDSRGLEVVLVDGQVGSQVLTDAVEPLLLFGGKRAAIGDLGKGGLDTFGRGEERMFGIGGSAFSPKYPGGNTSELLWQISRFHSFIWASGGLFNHLTT